MAVTIDGTTGITTPAINAGNNVGQVAAFAMSTPPEGWLKANGAAISRTTYADLFAAIGTTFGAGDGSTTFEIPDLRGEFIRGWDDGRGVDTGRVFGSSQTDDFGSHNHSGTTSTIGNHTHTQIGANTLSGVSSGSGAASGATVNTGSGGSHNHTVTVSTVGGTETRPINVALLACIKY